MTFIVSSEARIEKANGWNSWSHDVMTMMYALRVRVLENFL